MKFFYRIRLGVLYAEKKRINDKLHNASELLKGLKAFRYYANIDPTEFELKKQKLEKKVELLTSKKRYIVAQINSVKWKLF